MRKIIILIIFFLTSCSSGKTTNHKSDLIFSGNMNFEEFKKKLEIYAKESPYPNIDK